MLRTTHPVFFPIFGRYFHSPTDTKELLYDPASVMNDDTLKFCQKEAWCKMSFFVLSFFYYLYWWVSTINTATKMLRLSQQKSKKFNCIPAAEKSDYDTFTVNCVNMCI